MKHIALCSSLALLGPGCSSLGGVQMNASTAGLPSPHTLALMGGPTSETEREARLDAASEKPLNPKAIKGAFWGGLITGSVGGVMAIGFGAAGGVAANKLADSYADGINYADRDSMVSRGETYNDLAKVGAALMVTGFAVAAITYAIDATRCGPMRQKREGCTPN
jgi:hypothetical protein